MNTYRGGRADLNAILAAIPRALAGGPDPYGIAQSIQFRVGIAVLSKIQQAFIVKSRGGIGEDGIKWRSLKRSTIAQRRTTATERRTLGIGGNRVRGLLTPAQDKRWRAIYASNLAKLRLMVGEGAAKARAAQIAWAILKSEGAQTKLQVLGGRVVDIGRDTGRMFRSLTPGVDDQPASEPEQIIRAAPGAVIVGSNVPYFESFHRDRPVWPLSQQLPAPWQEAAMNALRTGVVRAVEQILQQGRA